MALTRRLANFVVRSHPEDIPPAVRGEALRAFTNIAGCMLGGWDAPACRAAAAATLPLRGAGRAPVIGHGVRADIVSASFLNALASTVHTFDDTHLATVVHPTGPAAAALLALAAEAPVSGREALHALLLGIEVTCRLATMLVVPPAHSDLAWFTTGLTAGVGAAATAARLLQLDEDRTVWALGLAAAQAGGFREHHATMGGALIPAEAARSGLQAALLARQGFNGPEAALEGPKGFAQVYGAPANPAAALEGLGERFQLLDLSYKPYPCGIVVHPAIDGCLDARDAHGLRPDDVAALLLRVHPLTLQLCGRRDPNSGMEAKNSVYHWTAAALLRGRAGLAEGEDACVADPAVRALSARITAEADPALAPEAARLVFTRRDGTQLTVDVPQARGSLGRPMSREDLSRKFLQQAVDVVPRPEHLLDTCWNLAELADLDAELLPLFGEAA